MVCSLYISPSSSNKHNTHQTYIGIVVYFQAIQMMGLSYRKYTYYGYQEKFCSIPRALGLQVRVGNVLCAEVTYLRMLFALYSFYSASALPCFVGKPHRWHLQSRMNWFHHIDLLALCTHVGCSREHFHKFLFHDEINSWIDRTLSSYVVIVY